MVAMKNKKAVKLFIDILLPIIIVICAIILFIKGSFDTALIVLCLAMIQVVEANFTYKLSNMMEEIQYLKTQIISTREEIINLKNQVIPCENQNKTKHLALTKQHTDQ